MINIASKSDIPSLVTLLNAAYRGEASKKGWTTEADMISGEIRTDEDQIWKLMSKNGSVFLKYVNDTGVIEGCVYLDKREEKLYLGMLCVNPELQAKGTGKKIMKAAEEYASRQGCTSIFMRVVSVRHELIEWYQRQGYQKTGDVQPFENSIYGTTTVPFEFLVMEKNFCQHDQKEIVS